MSGGGEAPKMKTPMAKSNIGTVESRPTTKMDFNKPSIDGERPSMSTAMAGVPTAGGGRIPPKPAFNPDMAAEKLRMSKPV